MADNVAITAGSGTNIKTDDDGTAHWQYVKTAYGADNTQTRVTAANGLPIQNDSSGSLSVDVTSSVPGTGATNLGKAIDAAAGATDTGIAALAVRDDALTTLTPVDGDYVPLRVSSTGALHVTGGGGGTEYSEDAATPATIAGSATLMERDDALSTITPIEGDWAGLRCSARGALWVEHDTNTPIPVTDGGGALTVDGTVTANLGATDNAVLDQIEVNTSYGDQTGGGVEASALRVTLANDSTGVLSVDDNGGSLTIDNADITTIAGAVSGTEMQVDVVAPLPAGTNAIGKLAANSGVDIGDVDIASISAGANLIGDVGLSGARTSGGTTLYKNIDVDETEDQVKGTAGQIYWIHAINLATAPRYLKFYNATAASVTVGTTVPDLTFPIPSQGDANGAGFTLSIPNGIAFGTAITIAATTGVADADSGAPGANEVIVNLGYA